MSAIFSFVAGMLRWSFRSSSDPRLFPRPGQGKQAAAVVVAIVALSGCGGSGDGDASSQVVAGAGYRFAAPGDWEVRADGRTREASAGDQAVSVTRFRLARPYRPALWPAVVQELDGVATRLAEGLGATVAERRTTRIAGRRGRLYRLDGADDGTTRIGFVLDGRTEYQLLCRGEAGSACARLFTSFRLT
jgi:hypothetical protein